MSFEGFLFVALVAILFNGVEPFQPFWNSEQQSFSSFPSRSHPVATEQVLAQTDQRFGKKSQKLTVKMAAVAAILDFLSAHLAILCTGRPNAHHQVSIQLVYRDVQNMNSQHFSHIYVYGPYKCMGKQI